MFVHRKLIESLIPKLIVLFAAVVSVANAQGQTVPDTLSLGKLVERQIKGGETHSFTFDVKAGHYGRAEVEEKNIDVVVSLFAPDGKLIVDMDGKDRLWDQAVSYIAEKDGTCRVEIKPYGAAGLTGSYTIKLSELRQATVLDEANKYHDEGKKLFKKGTKEDLRKSSLRFEQARNLYERSRDTRFRLREAATIDYLGQIYNGLGKKLQAIEYYKQALLIYRDQNLVSQNLVSKEDKAELKFLRDLQQTVQTETLEKIGKIYWDIGKKEEALKTFHEKIVIYRSHTNKNGEGYTLKTIGLLYSNSGDKKTAIEYYEQALTIFSLAENGDGQIDTLCDIGKTYVELKKKDKGLDYYHRALQVDTPRTINKAKIFVSLMKHFTLINNSLAISYGKQAINLYQEFRLYINTHPPNASDETKFADSLLEKKLAKALSPYYRELANLLVSEGRLLEAQAVLNLLKDGEYEQLARSGVTADTVPYSRTEADTIAKIENLVALGRQQTELRKEQKEQGDKFPAERLKRLEKLNADIKIANAEFDNALAALAKADSSVEARTLEIKSEKNLQSALQNLGKRLNTGAVALYTVIGTEGEKDESGKAVKDKTRSKFGWVMMVTPKDRKAYPIDVTNLEQTVFQFRNALSSDKYEPRPLAEKIYNAIFRQTSAKQKTTLETDLREILSKHPNKTLMWSLDGVLRYIPMAALHDGETYLVEKYRHVTFTKESLLWLMNQPKGGTQALGLGVSAGNKDLQMSSLPGVDKELSDIIKQTSESTGILNGTRRLNKDFKKQEILNLKDDDNSFQTVHIASHYSFSPTDQNASYLLIGDGKLTFGEMKNENNLFGSVDLLTLSACDTGVSGNGKEAEGFAYLAQSLGAKSVIASLWKVSDAGTPELMIRFYGLRAANPAMSKGEALRQAQLSLLGVNNRVTTTEKSTNPLLAIDAPRADSFVIGGNVPKLPLFEKDTSKPFAHPHYWSSFVLIGNWR